MAKAQYTTPEGNRVDVNLPDYALEQTQENIHKILKAQLAADKNALKVYDAMFKGAESYHKQQFASDTERNNHLKTQSESLKGLAKDSKVGILAGKSVDLLGSAASSLTTGLKTGLIGAVSLATTGVGILAARSMGLGNTLAELGTVGIGLEGVNDTTTGTISSLTRLGLTVDEAAGALQSSAGTIAAIGQDSFVKINSALASATASGAKFGMTMSGLAEIAAEDLDTRQRLGILDNLNAQQAAKRSATIYDQQLNATKLLGRSIDDIRAASRTTLQENAEFALRVGSISAKFGPTVAREFTSIMQSGLGNLAGSGLSQSLIDNIGNEIGASVAFASESGQELYKTLNMINPALNQSVQNMNNFAKAGDTDGVRKGMETFQKELLSSAADMTQVDFDALNVQIQAGNLGESGRELAKSLGELRAASQKFGKQTAAEFANLAIGAKTFDNTMNQVKGSVSGLFTDMSGALGPAFAGVASGFQDIVDETGKVTEVGISTAFKNVMTDVGKTLTTVFGDGSGEFKSLGDTLRDFVVPKIQQFGEWFKTGGGEALKSAWSSAKDMFNSLVDKLKALRAYISDNGGLAGAWEAAMGDAKEYAKTKFGELTSYLKTKFSELVTKFDDYFGGFGVEIAVAVGGIVALSKAASMAAGVFNGFKAMKSVLGAGAAAGPAGGAASAAGKGMATVGKGMASLGKGLGAGIGGVLKGFAIGLGAFANPKVLIGAGILGASITAIGAGIAGASWLMGETLPKFTDSLKGFGEVNGDNLVAVGGGLVSLAGGMAALGGGKIADGIGNLVGGLFNSASELFGFADDDSTGLSGLVNMMQDFANLKMDNTGIDKNAASIDAYATAMIKLSRVDMEAISAVVASSSKLAMNNLSTGITRSQTMPKAQAFSPMRLNSGDPNYNRMIAPTSPTAISPIETMNTTDRVNATNSYLSNNAGDVPLNARLEILEKYIMSATESSDKNAQLLADLISEQRKANKKADEHIAVTKKLA